VLSIKNIWKSISCFRTTKTLGTRLNEQAGKKVHVKHGTYPQSPIISNILPSYFQNFHLSSMTSVDADTGNGEVTIRLPPETYPIISGITELSNILSFLFLASKSHMNHI
jgi:hypothetical protein